MIKSEKGILVMLLLTNLVLLFFIPMYFFETSVNLYFWLTVSVFILGIYLAIAFSMVIHLYYFTYFLFVFIVTYPIQTKFGVRFLLDSTSVSVVTPTVFVFFMIHIFVLIAAGLIPVKQRPQSIHYSTRFSCVVVSLGVLLYTLFVMYIYPSSFFSSRVDQFFFSEVSSVDKIIVFTVKILPYLALIYIFQKACQVQNHWSYSILIIPMLILALLSANPINTPRFISLTNVSILLVFIISTIGSGRHKLPRLVLLSPYIILALLPLSSISRHGLNLPSLNEWTLSFTGLEFSSFQVLLDAFDHEGELVSSNYTLSSLFIFIPRSIWPGKSEGIGVEIASASGYIYTNTGVTSVFSVFADYGWIGLILFSFLIGIFMRRAKLSNGMFFQDRKDFYSILLFAAIPMLVRGDLSTFMISIYSFAIAYEGILFLSRLGSRGSHTFK